MKLPKFSPIVSVVILAVFFGGLFAWNKYSHTAQVPQVPEPTQTDGQTEFKLVDLSLVSEKSYKTSDQYTIFNVVYPQFKNVSLEFNKKIDDLVTSRIATHKKDSADNWKARYETSTPADKIPEFPAEGDKFYFNVSWKAAQVNQNFVSFLLTISAYTGGAHGYEDMISFNYDVVNKKEVALADLFPSDANYLKTISDFSRKDLEAQFHKRLEVKTKDDEQNFKDSVLPMLTEGTTPDAENFSIFTFTPDAVTIYFAQYQVAPYAMGSSTVVIPRK